MNKENVTQRLAQNLTSVTISATSGLSLVRKEVLATLIRVSLSISRVNLTSSNTYSYY